MIALGDTIPPQLGAEKPESLLPCHARCNPRCNSAQNTPTDDHHGLGGGGGEVGFSLTMMMIMLMMTMMMTMIMMITLSMMIMMITMLMMMMLMTMIMTLSMMIMMMTMLMIMGRDCGNWIGWVSDAVEAEAGSRQAGERSEGAFYNALIQCTP